MSDTEWQQLLAYSAAVFNNCGNFKSFGDTKFVPELPLEKFNAIVRSSRAYQTHARVIDSILSRIDFEIYCEDEPINRIGFPDDRGQTSYYSANVSKDDAKMVDEFCQSKGISPLNTRLFKAQDGSFELKICSRDANKLGYIGDHEFGGFKITVTSGDFADFMAAVVSNLEQAEHFASNET